MFKLNDEWLIELGLGQLPPHRKNQFLAHAYQTLETRVGLRLAKQMSDAQLDEFEGFLDRSDDEGARDWLEANHPDYRDVVRDEFNRLNEEIRSVADQIVAAG